MAWIVPRRTSLLVVLAYAACFRLVTITRPFQYDSEATGGSFFGIMARNYLQFPLRETHGMPVITVGRVPGTPLVFYADHPPLVPLLIAPVYHVFGVGEWQTRLPTAIATMLAIVMVYVLVERWGTTRAAALAAMLFAATPMVLYFGGQPEVLGMPLVLFGLVTVFAYLHFHQDQRPFTWAALLAAWTLAALTDWPAFILVPVLVSHFAATHPRRAWPWVLGLTLWAVAVFLGLNIYIAVAAHLPWDWMLPLLKGRTAIGMTAPFTAREWFGTAWRFNVAYHTAPLLVAAGLWLITDGVRLSPIQPVATVARLLLAWGALHVLISRQGVYNHEWWWWPLTPGLAIAAALMVDRMLTLVDHRQASPWRPVGTGILVALFAAWTAGRTYDDLYKSRREDPFTTMELGRAIQTAAPGPNDLAMLAWSADDPELWFYGNRPLRGDIWTIDELARRQFGPYADLVFGDQQPWPAPAAGLVFPAIYRDALGALHAYLIAHYPHVPLPPDIAQKFEIFNLRQPLR